jgi:outer membrane receptor for monomeric catechols
VRPGQVDATGALNETADPKGHAFLRSSMELPRGLSVGAALRWVDALHIDNGPTGGPVIGVVPAYWQLDTRLRGRRRATSRYPLSARTCYASTR